MPTLRTFVTVACLTVILMAAVSAQAKRDWQDGTWRDSDTTVQDVGAITNGTVTGGSLSATTVNVRRVFQDFVIETPTHFYVIRQRLRFRWSDPVPMTVNAPVRFAIQKQDVYVIGEDKKEYKVDLAKRILKEK